MSEDQSPDLDGLQKWSLWNELIAARAEAIHAGAAPEEALEAGLERIAAGANCRPGP